MFSELKVGLGEKPILAQLDWLMQMYCPGEGHFHYSGKRYPNSPSGQMLWSPGSQNTGCTTCWKMIG